MLYLDSSAIVKLVLDEAESAALREWIGERPPGVSSGLAAVEVRLTVRLFTARALPADRRAAAELKERFETAMSGIALLAIDDAVLARAGVLEPVALRALDAIHLATALSVDDLEAFVTYDRELGAAASGLGLAVAAPGL